MQAGRCTSCGGELVQRLGEVECAGCGMRVLRRDGAPARSTTSAPWDPPSQFAGARAGSDLPTMTAPAPGARDTAGAEMGLLLNPHVREVPESKLATERWMFLVAFFLGNVFVTYAYLYSGGPQGAQGVSFGSVAAMVGMSTLLAGAALYVRSASVKNGCMFLIIGTVMFSLFSIYKAATGGAMTLLGGLVVQTLLYGWLAAILLRDNELQ